MNIKLFLTSITSYLVDRRWAIVAILIGTLFGFISVIICVYWHLAIFGFNIAYIVSPLIAGFVETFVAKRKHGISTGAISAIVIFVSVNILGWVLPANPVTLNLFTLGGLALAFQAAFPILVNYLLFVVFIGVFTYIMGYLGNMLATVLEKFGRKQKSQDEELIQKHDFLLKTQVTSTSSIDGKIVSEYLGLVHGEAMVAKKDKNTKNKDYNPENELEKALNLAIQKLDNKSESMGADAVLEVQIEYVNVGGIAGNGMMVNAIGNAVTLK